MGSLPHEKNAVVSKSLRRTLYGSRPNNISNVKIDATIMSRARSIVSQVLPSSMSKKDVSIMFQQLDALFSAGATILKCSLWKSFLENHYLPDSELMTALLGCRAKVKNNVGNKTNALTGRTSSRPNEIQERNEEMEEVIRSHGPKVPGTAGSMFWVWSGNKDDTNRPLASESSVSECKQHKFPGILKYYPKNCEAAIMERFKPRNASKGQKNSSLTSIKYPHLSLLKRPAFGHNSSVICTTGMTSLGGSKKRLAGV
jgi:hypothetical protein